MDRNNRVRASSSACAASLSLIATATAASFAKVVHMTGVKSATIELLRDL